MAYVYRQYTETAHDSIYVSYKCTKCGEVQTFLHTMSTSVTYDDRTFTQRGFTQRQLAARDALQENMDVAMGSALLDAKDGDYAALKISHRCHKCGHREPWSQPTPIFLLVALFLCAGLGAAFTFPLIAGNISPLNITLCACGWSLAIIFGLWYLFRPIFLCMKTENLPEIARPIFTGTKEDALKAMQYLEKLDSKS